MQRDRREKEMMADDVRKKVRWRMVITGRVQGVGFRFRARAAAESLGVTGWVCNRWDGAVEMEVQGAQESVDRMLEMIGSSRWIQIDHIAKTQLSPVAENGFHIRSGL
jgi:acylphosphatase